MILGIVIGVVVMLLIILAFMSGYGMADMKYKSQDTEEEQ